MFRLDGFSRLIWESVPGWLAEPMGVVTAFGGGTLLLFALSLLYWLDERQSTATVVSYAFVALSAVIFLKTALGMPRPPETVRLIPLENDPYGFPSGHAVAAVVVYGGLATVRDRLDDPRVLAGVGVTVALIALSRVVLGMHYVGDVIAGTLLGVVVLATCRHRPARRSNRPSPPSSTHCWSRVSSFSPSSPIVYRQSDRPQKPDRSAESGSLPPQRRQ